MKAMRSGDIVAARSIVDAPGAMAGTGYHALAAAELGFRAGPSASAFEALRAAAGAGDLDLRMVQESLRRAFDDLAAQGLEDAATELGPAFFAAAPSADLRMAERVVSRLASAGRWPALLALLDQAAAVLNPARVDRLRLQAQMGMNDLAAAGQTLDRLLAADPQNADLVQRKASLLARLDRPAEAFGVVRAALEAGVAVDPVIAVDLGQRAGVPLDELIAFCHAHSPDHPAFPRLQAERFRMLLRLERPAEALAVAQQHLAFDPSSSWAWLGAAQILARMENEAEQADLAADLENAEGLPEAVRIKVLIHLRDYQAAEALLAKVPHDGQLDTELLTLIAAMRLRQGDYARLRPLIGQASRTSPALTAAAVTLASARRLFGRDPSPEDFADLASRLAPRRCPFEVRARHVLHLGGSLATGGAERQMALTASGSVDGWISEIALNSVKDHRNGLTELLQHAGVVCSSLKGEENSRRLRELMAQDPRHIDAVQRLGSLPTDIASEALLCYVAIVAHRPAVVHCWQDRMNIRGGLAAVAAGVPRIVLTGRHSYRELWRNRHPEMANLLTGLLRQGNVTFQCNSDFGARSLTGWLDIDPTKVGVIRNGYDTARSDALLSEGAPSAQLRTEAGFSPDDIVVGNAARFVAFKRQNLWLEMLAGLMARNDRVKGLLVGDGLLETNLREQARQLGIADRVFFAGRRAPIEPWMAAMDLFVYTAAAEGDGMPNVLIESQAVGCPVASVRAGGSLETFAPGESGVLLEGERPEAWVGQLAPLIADPRRLREMSQAAILHVRRNLSLQSMLKASAAVWSGEARA